MEEYQAEENYWGYGDSYLDGRGYRIKGTRPKAVLDIEFSKSLLSELDEDEEYDEWGRKKKGATELKDIDISEISYVDQPATKKKFSVIKNEGGEQEMNGEMIELKGWEDVSEKEITVIKETISILNKYDLVDDLKRAKETLTKYFSEGEVKKYNERCEWSTVQNQLYGFTEDDLAMVNNEDIYEVSKSNEDNKWPSLSGQFERNRKVLERIWEERNIEARAI